jgi:hypothetical protein
MLPSNEIQSVKTSDVVSQNLIQSVKTQSDRSVSSAQAKHPSSGRSCATIMPQGQEICRTYNFNGVVYPTSTYTCMNVPSQIDLKISPVLTIPRTANDARRRRQVGYVCPPGKRSWEMILTQNSF